MLDIIKVNLDDINYEVVDCVTCSKSLALGYCKQGNEHLRFLRKT